jgi:hypothetical protein
MIRSEGTLETSLGLRPETFRFCTCAVPAVVSAMTRWRYAGRPHSGMVLCTEDIQFDFLAVRVDQALSQVIHLTGLMRAGAVWKLAPPLLDPFYFPTTRITSQPSQPS